MSDRYYSSPTLRLRIGKSRLRTTLYAVLCLVVIVALGLLYVGSYGVLVVVLSLPVAILLWHLKNDRMVGLELSWRQGIWALERDGVQRAIATGKRSMSTPWVTCLAVTDLSGCPAGYLWIFADSASSQQLRRLRVRLTLQH